MGAGISETRRPADWRARCGWPIVNRSPRDQRDARWTAGRHRPPVRDGRGRAHAR
jgi:hypothetical protein